MGAGVVGVAEFLLSLCSDALGRGAVGEHEGASWDVLSSLSLTCGGGSRAPSVSSASVRSSPAHRRAPSAPTTNHSTSHNSSLSVRSKTAGARAVPRPGVPYPGNPSLPDPSYSAHSYADQHRVAPTPTHLGRPVHSVSLMGGAEELAPSVPVAIVSLADLEGGNEPEDEHELGV